MFGEPAPIIYRMPYGLNAHQISVVDLDKHDIELQMWVDHEYMGSGDVELNLNVDCGEDVTQCLNLHFGTAFVVIPPGWHIVRAEIRKCEYSSISSPNPLMSSGNESEAFVWGKKCWRRVMWLVQQCG